MLPDFEVIASDDGFVVHDARRDVVHYLNQTAAIVLCLCDGKRSISQIADLIANQFALGATPHDDVMAVVTRFESEGLVTWAGDNPR